ncbi:sensor histidine kinase [Robinsoniella peoriensis]
MFRKISYQKKTLFIYTALVITIFVVFIVIYGFAQTKNMKDITDSSIEQLSVKAASQFESILNDMSDITLGLAANETVHEILEMVNRSSDEGNYFQKHPEEKRKIQREIAGVSGMRFEHKSFDVMSANFDLLSLNIYPEQLPEKSRIREIDWVKYMTENRQSKLILPVGRDEYGRTQNEVFSFVRVIQDEFERYGMVDVQYEKKLLDDIFKVKLQENEMQVIVLYNNELFYATEGAPLQELENLDDTAYTISSQFLNNYEMKIFMLARTSDYMKPVYDTVRTIIVLGVIVLSFIIFVVYIISYNLNKPIRELRNYIDHMDYLSLSLDFKADSSNDEIKLLANAFENMFEGIKRTRDELIEAHTREIKANYDVLQAQINPHFIHNILSVIGMIGYEKNAPEIMDMCAALTRMLQYTTQTGQRTTVVGLEFEHARTYLQLMKYRYLDILDFQIELDEEMEQVEIPKFVLQPVVENCFQHSFVDSEKPVYRICVKGAITKDGWEISVDDNGSGFTEESVRELNKQFRGIEERIKSRSKIPDMQIGGLALNNTYARLFIYSGGEITLRVGSSFMGGSCVVIAKSHKS